jgi:predicted nucleic acid-binding protein
VTSYVLDASVAAKWFLTGPEETLVEAASDILSGWVADRIQLIVPDIFWAEMGSIFLKAVRLGRIPKTVGREALSALAQQKLRTFPTLPLLEIAYTIAESFGRSIYESLYVALAVTSNYVLVTADERLANVAAAHFPVRWLGAV